MAHPTRIMYIERKGGEFVDKGPDWNYGKVRTGGSLTGSAHIGRVTFSKTGKTLSYDGVNLQSLKGGGKKTNYIDIETGEEYWISGPKKRGGDALYATNIPTEIDEDVREEYWTVIRNQPERKAEKHT